MTIYVSIEFMGSLPELEPDSGTEFKFVKHGILSVFSLDAIHATPVTCLYSGSTDEMGRHLQNRYRFLIVPNLPEGRDQTIDKTGIFIPLWRPNNLSIFASSIKIGSMISKLYETLRRRFICNLQQTCWWQFLGNCFVSL